MRGRSTEEGGRKGPVAAEPRAQGMGLPGLWNEDRFWFLRLVQDINQQNRAPLKPAPRGRGERRRGAREARRGGR
jgi:hypothetical protein